MDAPLPPLDSFPGPVRVLVTGASRGIGLAVSRALAGHPRVELLVATCRRPGAAVELGALLDAPGRHAIALDVTCEASVANCAARTRELTDRLDLVLNCAGILHEADGLRPEKRLADLDPGAMARAYQVNAVGPALVAKHLAPLLPRAGRCVFASISARVGSIGDNRLGGWYAYRASKAAQNMITRNLSIELPRRARGALCVGLHPGTVDTDLSRPFQARVPPDKLFDPARAARQLLAVIDGLDDDANGRFYAWDATEIPW